MRKFLETDVRRYNRRISVEEAKVPQAKLVFIDAQTKQAGETVFPNYFPVDMLKQMLSENGFELAPANTEL